MSSDCFYKAEEFERTKRYKCRYHTNVKKGFELKTTSNCKNEMSTLTIAQRFRSLITFFKCEAFPTNLILNEKFVNA